MVSAGSPIARWAAGQGGMITWDLLIKYPSRILIIRTPNKVPLILGYSHMGPPGFGASFPFAGGAGVGAG